MVAPYILARTLKEAHAYAREALGLTVGHYRVVNSAPTLKAVRNADLHLVPGWQNRYDRFAMKSALRWTRMNVVEASKEAPPASPPSETVPGTPDGLQPPGDQLSIDEMLAISDEVVAEVEVKAEETEEAEPEPTEEKPKRRRRRCKDCGVLVDPDEIDSHAAEHEAEPAGSA